MGNTIIPLILAGGLGTRLWPLSVQDLPKQFLPLLSDFSLLQETVLRVSGDNFGAPIIICNEKHKNIVKKELQKINISNVKKIFLEPVGRSTAPAIAIAAFHEVQKDKDPIFLVMPADHAIKDRNQLLAAIKLAKQFADQEKLVTFGIKPTRPETGYGYIKCQSVIDSKAKVYPIEKFVEKPNLAKATQYLNEESYFWNSGMFMFRASVFLEELKKFALPIYKSCAEIATCLKATTDVVALPEKAFALVPSNSIDYAVMEKTKKGVMVRLDAGWSDIGSWQSLWEYQKHDSNGNVVLGDVFIKKVNNSYIRSSKKKVVVVGLDDVVVVEGKNSFLVAAKNVCGDLNKLLENLKK